MSHNQVPSHHPDDPDPQPGQPISIAYQQHIPDVNINQTYYHSNHSDFQGQPLLYNYPAGHHPHQVPPAGYDAPGTGYNPPYNPYFIPPGNVYQVPPQNLRTNMTMNTVYNTGCTISNVGSTESQNTQYIINNVSTGPNVIINHENENANKNRQENQNLVRQAMKLGFDEKESLTFLKFLREDCEEELHELIRLKKENKLNIPSINTLTRSTCLIRYSGKKEWQSTGFLAKLPGLGVALLSAGHIFEHNQSLLDDFDNFVIMINNISGSLYPKDEENIPTTTMSEFIEEFGGIVVITYNGKQLIKIAGEPSEIKDHPDKALDYFVLLLSHPDSEERLISQNLEILEVASNEEMARNIEGEPVYIFGHSGVEGQCNCCTNLGSCKCKNQKNRSRCLCKEDYRESNLPLLPICFFRHEAKFCTCKYPTSFSHGNLKKIRTNNLYYSTEYVPVPLIGVDIEVRVVNFVAQVEVTQKYVNKEKNPVDAVYCFPVEEEAAVVGFTVEVEGRTIKTMVKEKEQEKYKGTLTGRGTNFVLEEIRPGIFQVKVGHLSPGDTCEITITYLIELPVEDGKTRITIPTTIIPKYIPHNDNSVVSKKIDSITLKMDTLMKTKIKEITSPSHKIDNKIENTQDQYGFFVSTTICKVLTSDMDGDIIFLINTDEPNEPKFVLEKAEDESVVGMLSLVPSFELKDHTAEIIFLIDCSRSMSGANINLAKETLQLFLHSLPVDCYFNIFRFGSRFESIFPESKMKGDTTLQVAKQLTDSMDADFGSTELLSPLKHIFSQERIPDRPRQLFVLTNGAVSNSEACIKITKQNSTTARVFTLGIGAGADRHLVKGMARAGKGTAVFATYGELIAPKVLRQLKNSLTPCISNIKVDWGDGSTNNHQLFTAPVMETTKTQFGYGKPVQQEHKNIILETQAPMIVPPVYDGSRLLLYKMYKKEKLPKKVKLTAETPEGNLDLEIPVEADCLKGNSIHKMFARKMIQDLEEDNYGFANNESNKEYIVELGTKYGLATKFTSFIGYDGLQNGLQNRSVNSGSAVVGVMHNVKGIHLQRSGTWNTAQFLMPVLQDLQSLATFNKIKSDGNILQLVGSSPNTRVKIKRWRELNIRKRISDLVRDDASIYMDPMTDFQFLPKIYEEQIIQSIKDMAASCDERGLNFTIYGDVDEKTVISGTFHCIEQPNGKISVTYSIQSKSIEFDKEEVQLEIRVQPGLQDALNLDSSYLARSAIERMGVVNISTSGETNQTPNIVEFPPRSWAELVQDQADRSVENKDDTSSPFKHFLSHGNNPYTRIMVLSKDTDYDNKLIDDVIMKDANRKADAVKYLVVPIQDFTQNDRLSDKEAFISKVKLHFRPTIFVMKPEYQEFYQALKENHLIGHQLTESNDGNIFYEATNIYIRDQEPDIIFSVGSSGQDVREELRLLLKQNKHEKNMFNKKSTKILVISGTHGGQRKKEHGIIEPIDSGLSDENYLNNSMYQQDCTIVGIQPNPSQFVEYRRAAGRNDGDFQQWKMPAFNRPNILSATPLNPMPQNSLLSHPDFNQMQFQILDVANYHDRPELRGKSSAAIFKRSREFFEDVRKYNPTVIFIGWNFSLSGDIAMALRSEAAFSAAILEHQIRVNSQKSCVKLDNSQRKVLENTYREDMKHTILTGPYGVGKSSVGYELVKIQAIKLKKENPENIINARVIDMSNSNGRGNLGFYCHGFVPSQVKHMTKHELCKELEISIKDDIEMIKAVCLKEEAANRKTEDKIGQKSRSILMFDNVNIKPISKEESMVKLEDLDTIRTISCIRPIRYSRRLQLKLSKLLSCVLHEGRGPTEHVELNVMHRNTTAIKSFYHFFVDHESEFNQDHQCDNDSHEKESQYIDTHSVIWIHCDEIQYMENAIKKILYDIGNENLALLVNEVKSKNEVYKQVAKASGVNQIFGVDDFVGFEARTILYVTNESIRPEAISRAIEKLVLVTGPDTRNQSLLRMATEMEGGREMKCRTVPCPLSEDKNKFPLIQHSVQENPDTALIGLVALLKNVQHKDRYIPVPLTKVDIQIRVVNFTAQVEISQKYVNREKKPIEAIYFFPVEEEAALVGFYVDLEGRTVKTEVKEKKQAKEEFKMASSNRQTAALLEESCPDIFKTNSTRPDIIQVTVGHLSPGASCEVTIIYLTVLPVEEGKTRITIPTTITPKYIPASDNSALAMALKMDILMKTKIKKIVSLSHTIDNKIEDKKDQFGYFVSTTVLEGLIAELDRDIVFLVDTDEPNEPFFVLENDDDESIVGMLSFVPRFELKDHKVEIIFLIDCSSSMNGANIKIAKSALMLYLLSLPVDCYFNIFRFGSRCESLFPESKMYDDATMEQAKQLAHTLDANFGGTEILIHLSDFFSQELIAGRPRQMFLLTNGAVTNSAREECIALTRQHATTARVFTVGIGAGADRHLVKGMARAGKGTSVFIIEGELIAQKVLQQLKHSLTPCLNNVKVDWGDGSSVKESTASILGDRKPKQQDPQQTILDPQAPLIVPPIYDQSRFLMYKIYKKENIPKVVNITAETPEGELGWKFCSSAPEGELEGNSVHQLFARKMIQNLQESLDEDVSDGEQTKARIVELGNKYGLASKFTSFVGIDEKQNRIIDEKLNIEADLTNVISRKNRCCVM